MVAKEDNASSYSRPQRLGNKNRKLTGWSRCIHTCEVGVNSGGGQVLKPQVPHSGPLLPLMLYFQKIPQCSETMLLAGEQVCRETSLHGPLPIPTLHTVWSQSQETICIRSKEMVASKFPKECRNTVQERQVDFSFSVLSLNKSARLCSASVSQRRKTKLPGMISCGRNDIGI